MSLLRFKVIDEAIKRKAVQVSAPPSRPSEYFGEKVFTKQKMAQYLPQQCFEALCKTISHGKALDSATADCVAEGMKQWASEMGATHYTHWFQPLTGGTAEKHDSFIDPDHKGGVIEKFSGKLLIQQEPDASSFPSGGIRNTFEARGYTAWDPSSPAFIIDDTLCIPTIFISYTGESLDFKSPLLKSVNAVDKAAVKVCKLFDEKVTKVFSYLGWEQEYFLVDEGIWAARPDLMLTGRTLMGHESAKNQQLEDHYFGSIPTRVAAFMKDLEYESLKLGIPVKTRHNEVAPNQFELAPVFEEVNLANDHNVLLMSVMKKVARRHSFRVLLHEKPFKGINGSGKHNNWSLGTDTGINLLSPGKTPQHKLQFVTFLVNVMMAVYRHNGLLKASISSATNAHRLGANEAPPAIISIFLGSQMSGVIKSLEKCNSSGSIHIDDKHAVKLSIGHIPEILIDNTDRNRTSPFAFTGNRFEFRAVGSSANCANAMMVLNTSVATQLTEFHDKVTSELAKGSDVETAVITILKDYVRECSPIHFDGNGYSEQWKEEAEKRGLDCETSVPLIFDRLIDEETQKMFALTGVLSDKELHARAEVAWETYTKKIQIEARVLGDIALNHIIPVATRYQDSLLGKIEKARRIFSDDADYFLTSANDIKTVKTIAEHTNMIQELTEKMISERKQANGIENEREKAISYHDNVAVFFDQIRYHIDKLELMVDNNIWPLPKYRELIFIR